VLHAGGDDLMGRRRWERANIDRLFSMREVQRLKWREIGNAFGLSAAMCCARYQYYKGAGSSSDAPAAAPAVAATLAAPVKTMRPVEPVIHRPRYIHEADMDIIARIDRQGLTAGFLGDPPEGRSALDQRQGSVT